MRTVVVDPVSAALLTTRRNMDAGRGAVSAPREAVAVGLEAAHPEPFLSFVTVDRPPPVGWIGQRVAIYAGRRSGIAEVSIVADEIVGSGTLAEALPIYEDADDCPDSIDLIEHSGDTLYIWRAGEDEEPERSIHDQLPLQDWSAGRWALRFTDVAPTEDRCPDCWGRGYHDVNADGARADDGVYSWECPECDRIGFCPPVVAPVLSGDDPTYKEWTP
jgi:hypothetical protein